MKIVVHPSTATVVRADECLIVDIDALWLDALTESVAVDLWSALEEGLDLEVVEIAERYGVQLADLEN